MVTILIYSIIFFSLIIFMHLILCFATYKKIKIFLYDPFIIFSFLFGLVFFLRPFFIITQNVEMIEYDILEYDTFFEATLYSGISFLLIFLFYWLSLLLTLKYKVNDYDIGVLKLGSKGRLILFFITLATLTVIYNEMTLYGANFARNYGEDKVSETFFFSVLIRQFSFAFLFLLIFYLMIFKVSKIQKIIFGILWLTLLFELIVASGRGVLFMSLFFIGVIWLKILKNKLLLFLIPIFVFFTAILLPLLGTIRLNILEGYSWQMAILSILQLQTLFQLLSQLSWDFSMWDVYLRVLNYYDSSNMYYGYGFFSALLGLFPRIFWESKPIYTGTMLLTTTDLYPGLQENNGTGLYPTFLGEAFQNFGFPGIMIYSVLIGMFLAMIFRWINSQSIIKMALGAMMLPYIYHLVRGGFDWIFAVGFLQIIPFLLLLYVLMQFSKRG